MQTQQIADGQMSLLEACEIGIDKVNDLKTKLKYTRESLATELEQSEEYAKTAGELKIKKAEHKLAKMRAMQNPICVEIADRVDELKADLKIEKQSLSATLVYYNEETKKDTIYKGDDTYKIVKTAAVKKEPKPKKKKKKN